MNTWMLDITLTVEESGAVRTKRVQFQSTEMLMPLATLLDTATGDLLR